MIILENADKLENCSIKDSWFYGFNKRAVITDDVENNTNVIDIDNAIIIAKESIRFIKLLDKIILLFTKTK